MKIKCVFIILVLLIIPSVVKSSENTSLLEPTEVIKQILEQLLAGMREKRLVSYKNTAGFGKRMEDVVFPHVNKKLISRLVLGKYWRTANESQKKRFTKEFSSLLVHKYIKILNNHIYNDIMVKYLPVRGKTGDTEIIVRTIAIISESDENINNYHVNYYMRNNGDGWKIYDVSVERLRFIFFYRSLFYNKIRKNGIESALKYLERKNSKK